MTKIRRLLVLAVAATLAVSTLGLTASAETRRSHPAEAERTYRVTVTNLTEGQPMTPFVVATHQNRFKLFGLGRPASDGLQQLAENGGVPVLVDELVANSAVSDVQVAAPAAGPPVHPGESVTVEVTANKRARWISLAGMLICTNDGFAGVSHVRVPTQSRTIFGRAYDAGTEINTESYADLVPPCDGLGLAGETNPDLAENRSIRPHLGITGNADLDPSVHGWSGAVIMVEIERLP